MRAPGTERRTPFSIVLTIAAFLFAGNAAAQTAPAPRCGTGVHEAEALGAVFLPRTRSSVRYSRIRRKLDRS